MVGLILFVLLDGIGLGDERGVWGEEDWNGMEG